MPSTTMPALLFTVIGILLTLVLPAQDVVEPGRLRLEISNRDAFVRIDSVVYDLSSRSHELELVLPPGPHLVELRASGRRREQLAVTIHSGRTTIVTGDLSQRHSLSVRTLTPRQLERRAARYSYLGLSGFLLLDAFAVGQWSVLDRNEQEAVEEIEALYDQYSASVADIEEVGEQYQSAIRAYNRQHFRHLLFRGAAVALAGGTVYAFIRQLRRNRRAEGRFSLRPLPPLPGVAAAGLHLTYAF